MYLKQDDPDILKAPPKEVLTLDWMRTQLNFPNEEQRKRLDYLWQMFPDHLSELFAQVANSDWLKNRLTLLSANEKKLLKIIGEYGRDTVEALLKDLLEKKPEQERKKFKRYVETFRKYMGGLL